MTVPASPPPSDEYLPELPRPRRRRKHRPPRGLNEHLHYFWKQYRRLLPRVLLLAGLPVAMAAGLYGLHRFSERQTRKAEETRKRQEQERSWANLRKVRAFSLTNLTKLERAGERRATRQQLQIAPSDLLSTKESLADAAFQGRNYAEAERLYREILPASPKKALTLYRMFVARLMQQRRAEAEMLFPGSGQSLAKLYAMATLAFADGNAPEGEKLIEQARLRYAALCGPYDEALRETGLRPPAEAAPAPGEDSGEK